MFSTKRIAPGRAIIIGLVLAMLAGTAAAGATPRVDPKPPDVFATSSREQASEIDRQEGLLVSYDWTSEGKSEKWDLPPRSARWPDRWLRVPLNGTVRIALRRLAPPVMDSDVTIVFWRERPPRALFRRYYCGAEQARVLLFHGRSGDCYLEPTIVDGELGLSVVLQAKPGTPSHLVPFRERGNYWFQMQVRWRLDEGDQGYGSAVWNFKAKVEGNA